MKLRLHWALTITALVVAVFGATSLGQAAVKNGVSAAKQPLYASHILKRGPRGPRGKRGPRGRRGPQGPRGAQGPTGAKGATGSRGPTGARGPGAVSFDKHLSNSSQTLATVDGLYIYAGCENTGAYAKLELDRTDKTDVLVTGTRSDATGTKHENAAYPYEAFSTTAADNEAGDFDVIARGADGKWARVTAGVFRGSDSSCNFWGQITPSS